VENGVVSRGLSAALPTSWLDQIISVARDLEESLTDSERLSALVSELAAVASAAGASMVTGASPLGHQLAGAMAASGPTRLALWAQNGARGTVLVIEGVLASGAQLASTARRARAAGASRVIGAAVIADERGLSHCRSELGDEVHALRELVLTG
jgi:hypothetical protein